VDWNAVRTFYLQCRSLKQTAERFGLPLEALKKRVQRQRWRDMEGTFQGTSHPLNVPPCPPSGDIKGTFVPSEGTSQGTSRASNVPPCPSSGDSQGTFVSPDVPSERVTGDIEGTCVPSADVPPNVPSLFTAEVTTYPNAMSPDCPAVDTLAAVLDAIQTGQFRKQVEELRRVRSRDGKAVYDREKTRLPAFTACGTTRDRKRIDKHSGFLQLDFDGLGGDLPTARQNVMRDPHVAAAFVSPSADGLKVLVRVPRVRHEACVKEATRYFLEHYQLRNDPQVKEPARLCFVSYDPDLHRNENASPLPLPENHGDPPAAQRGRPKNAPPWWAAFKGDLTTLDLITLFREANQLGDCLDPDNGKHSVRCPWCEDHGNGGTGWKPNSSDTVIFAEGRWPAFKCLHAHCSERTLQDVCQWFESRLPGNIDRHCRLLRRDYADESLRRGDLTSPWGEPTEGAQERLVRLHGEPFAIVCDEPGAEPKITDFNHHYWTAQFAFESLVIYEPCANQFYVYHEERGLWSWHTEAVVRGIIANYLLGYSRRLNQPILETDREQGRLADMVVALKAVAEKRDPFRKFPQVIHLANGMLHVDTDPPQLRSFSPHYFSLRQCPVAFDAQALCSRFLSELVYPAMLREDAGLLQLVGGMILTGHNGWQKMLILSGQGGAGKGTISRVLQGLVGMENVKQLRTHLLGDRFELDNLDQATLLVGSDVGGDFLMCSGAKVIKALTGGDPLTMETKGGRKRDVYGQHNIIITSNDRLRVKLDGDESAWKRRLLIIPFEQQSAQMIEGLDVELLREEGSGILNWFLLGTIRLREASRRRERFPVTPLQAERVESLLCESDSLRLFVKRGITRETGCSVTIEELFTAYENHCNAQGWAPLSRKRFETQVGPLMMELHRAARRNDIERGSNQKRGFMGVRIQELPDELEVAA
jgi:putative DNA primase/helicase